VRAALQAVKYARLDILRAQRAAGYAAATPGLRVNCVWL